MRNSKRWTAEEDQVLTTLIKEHFSNKQVAFKKASEEIGRNPKACSQRWYSVLSNPTSPHYVGTAFLSISEKRMVRNRTTKSTIIPETSVKKSLFQKLLNLLKIK